MSPAGVGAGRFEGIVLPGAYFTTPRLPGLNLLHSRFVIPLTPFLVLGLRLASAIPVNHWVYDTDLDRGQGRLEKLKEWGSQGW